MFPLDQIIYLKAQANQPWNYIEVFQPMWSRYLNVTYGITALSERSIAR